MGKPKRSGSGFSAAKPAAAPKQQFANGSADHAVKEQQAVALINQGKLQEAEAIYRDLIADGTKNHIVYCNLAAICAMQGRFDDLINLLNTALQLKPNYPDAHNNLGNALKEQGDLDAAIASYNTALQLKSASIKLSSECIQSSNASSFQVVSAQSGQPVVVAQGVVTPLISPPRGWVAWPVGSAG